ncbi:MAG: hypothetical protein HYZ88_03185 [Candidatus Omnitrophica bacterium]|nr:hypothetical protein [Candidatus Omnitrophota bacterium]
MKLGKKLTKSAIAELKEQYAQLKQDSDHAYEAWSKLSADARAVEAVLVRNGVRLKKDEESKPAVGKSSAATLRLAITKILKAEGNAIKASVIREKLRQKKIRFRPAYFWRVIGRMEGKGAIRRVGAGLYQLQNGAVE